MALFWVVRKDFDCVWWRGAARCDPAAVSAPVAGGGGAGRTPQYLRAYLGPRGEGPGGSGRGGTPCPELGGH